ncbi:MAG: aminotransferase class IV [Salinivirgaceae bacterium]|nr:aminotransferase class IV [Salinivirgaceae bacterium]
MSSNYNLISFNKEYIPSDAFRIKTTNRAFRYGDGFFESMHANGLEVQFINDHFERILYAANCLDLELPEYFSLEFLKKQISGLLSRLKLFQGARVRLSIYRSGEGFYIPETNRADVLIEAAYLSKGFYELNISGITIDVYKDVPKQRTAYGAIKSINAMFYVLAGNYAKKNNLNDVLLVDAQEIIVEATSSNFFAIKGNELYTPSLELGCVHGIMRKQILNRATNMNYIIHENAILKESDLLLMDELFLTNAVVGIKYVSGFRNKRYFKRSAQKMVHALNQLAFPNS